MTTTTWSWRIPCIFQGLPALIVAIAIVFIPESPRYLYCRGRTREAEAILTYYHANGQESHPIVTQQMAEISTALGVEAELEPQSFLSTLKVPAYRKCYSICIAVAIFTNWCGQSVISYYFSPILKSLGISSTPKQTGINGGMQVWNLLCSLTGAFLAERIGRRPLWLASFIGMIAANVPLTITSAIYAQQGGGNQGAARATIVFLFLYNAAFNIACNPLLYSYAPEILPYRIRGKGMGLCILTSEIALTVNQYVNPIALAKIGYYFYIFYLGVLLLATTYIYFFFPETKGLTLEELSQKSLHRPSWLEASAFRKVSVLDGEEAPGEIEVVKPKVVD